MKAFASPEARVRAYALLSLVAACAPIRAELLIEVRNNRWERFQEVQELRLSDQQAGAAQGRELAEIGLSDQVLHAVPFSVDVEAPGGPVLSWICPGVTSAGAVRRFAFVPGSSVPTPSTGGSDLAVASDETHVVVSNTYFEVCHPRRGGGGFPDRVEFRLSGAVEEKLVFLDRLYRKEARRQCSADQDAAAVARFVFQSPVRVVVEAQTGYRDGGGYAPGNPRAVYRYIYSPFSPVVRVESTVTRDDEELWDELHFLEVSRADQHYTSFITGEEPKEHRMLPRGAKSVSHSGRHWAVMATSAEAVGVGFGGGTCWDAADEFVYYVSARRNRWSQRTVDFSGALYFGPAPGDLVQYSRWLGPDRAQQVALVDTDLRTTPQGDESVVGAHELKSESLRVVFGDAQEGFPCLAIDNLLGPPTRFVHPRPDTPTLWQIELRTPCRGTPDEDAYKVWEEEAVLLDNRGDALRSAQMPDARTLVMTWRGLDLPNEPDALDVTVRVVLAPGAGASEWRLEVDNRSQHYGLWETSYPYLATVAPKGTADVVLPGGNWGGRLLRQSRSACNGRYPSGACPAQFFAFNRGQAGLYIAAHDGAARAKRLVVTADQDVTFVTAAEDMGVPGSDTATPFPVAIAAYRGDWWQAARLYRAWATEQAWTQKGWISDRTDIPRQFTELGFWMLGSGMPTEVRKWMIQTQGLFAPLSVGLHWYSWHEIPFDHSYPEYFPTKPDFGKIVRELTGRGQVMMPYINGRLWDRDIESFAVGEPAAAKQPHGEVYTEVYGSKRRLSPMCPATPLWQDKVNEITHRLIHECGVNAIYLDQIGAAAPRWCFDESHGHPVGGGRHWVDGYRTMLDRTKADAAANNVALTTENTAEPYMDNIDGFLAWSPRYDTDIPLLPAVYSGYTIYFTSPQDAGDDLAAFVMAQGRDFLWGCQLGWNGTWILEERHRAKAEFQKLLCEYRLAAKDFLVYGQLLDELRPAEPVAQLTSVWHRRAEHSATLPAVMGTLWRSRSGELGLFLVNFDDVPRRFRYVLNAAEWGGGAKPGAAWVVSRLSPSGLVPWELAPDPELFRSELLGGHEIRVLTVRPATDLAQAMDRARDAAASGSQADPVLRECAQTFLFGAKLAEWSMSVVLPDASVTVARGEPVSLSTTWVNRSATSRRLEIRWPHGEKELVVSAPGESGERRAVFWPGEMVAGEGGQPSVEVVLVEDAGRGTANRRSLWIREVSPLAVSLGTVSRVRGGESFLLPVEVRNNSRSVRGGVVALSTPDGWEVEPSSRFVIGDLAPGATRPFLVKCRVPHAQTETRGSLRAQVLEDAGAVDLTILKSRPRAGCRKFAKPPAIDGDLTEWADYPAVDVGAVEPEGVKISSGYEGVDDCSARLRLGWDAAHLYLAAEVRDDVHSQDSTQFELWRGDCIQLAFRNGPPNEGSGFDGSEHEIGLTVTGDGRKVLFQWMPGACPLEQGDLVVLRDDGVTRYEAAIPWAAAGLRPPTAGSRTAWSFTINDNDGAGFRGWLEWTPGVCGGKDSSAFGWLEFGD